MEKLNITQLYDDCILDALPNTQYVQNIKSVFVVGAYWFQEYNKMKKMLPIVEKFHVFEPVSFLFNDLKRLFFNHSDVSLYNCAIGDFIGEAEFNLSNNDASSSSLLPMKEHKNIFPGIFYNRVEKVQVKTINYMIETIETIPDFLFMDVQGMEYRIITSISPEYLKRIQLIYTEVSLVEVYEGGKLLKDIQNYLTGFEFVYFTPLINASGLHGNALFINKEFFNV